MHDARAAGEGTSGHGDPPRGLPLHAIRNMALRCGVADWHACAAISDTVAAMTRLTQLSLCVVEPSAGLHALARSLHHCAALQEVEVLSVEPSCPSPNVWLHLLAGFAHCVVLRRLRFNACTADAAAHERLGAALTPHARGLTAVTSLTLGSPHDSTPALRACAPLSATLQELSLFDYGLAGREAEPLAHLTALTALTVDGEQCSVPLPLRALQQLRCLIVDVGEVTGDVLSEVAHATQLSKLTFPVIGDTDIQLTEGVCSLQQLQHLCWVTQWPLQSEVATASVAKLTMLGRLTYLQVNVGRPLALVQLASFGKLPHLRSCTLRMHDVADSVPPCAGLFPSPRHLRLHTYRPANDSAGAAVRMTWLLRGLTVLTRLYLVLGCDGPPSTMGAALGALAACTGLQQLELLQGEVRAGADSASCAAALRQLTCLTKLCTTHVQYEAAALDSLVRAAAALPVLQEVCIYRIVESMLQSACASAREVAADTAQQQAATLRAFAESCATPGAWAHTSMLCLDCLGTFDAARLGNQQQVTAMTSDTLRQCIEVELLQKVIEGHKITLRWTSSCCRGRQRGRACWLRCVRKVTAAPWRSV